MARSRKSGGKTATKKAASEPEPPGIDAVLDQLEEVVSDLEEGDLPLEDALTRFEEGVRLARAGGQLLEALEERVEMLLEDRDETVPFTEEESDDD